MIRQTRIEHPKYLLGTYLIHWTSAHEPARRPLVLQIHASPVETRSEIPDDKIFPRLNGVTIPAVPGFLQKARLRASRVKASDTSLVVSFWLPY